MSYRQKNICRNFPIQNWISHRGRDKVFVWPNFQFFAAKSYRELLRLYWGCSQSPPMETVVYLDFYGKLWVTLGGSVVFLWCGIQMNYVLWDATKGGIKHCSTFQGFRNSGRCGRQLGSLTNEVIHRLVWHIVILDIQRRHLEAKGDCFVIRRHWSAELKSALYGIEFGFTICFDPRFRRRTANS